MNEISKFYKELLETVGLQVGQDGLVSIHANGIDKPLDIGGVPMYLPTDENINTMTAIVDGKPTPVKTLFNPLEEDVYKGVNESFTKLKKIMELKLIGVIGQLGVALLSIINSSSEDITDMELVKFINVLNKNKVGKRKSLVDEKTITNWIAIYSKVIANNDHRFVKFYAKNGGKIDGVTYTRTGVIQYPFVEKFQESMDEKTDFLDIKLRVIDRQVILSMFDYMFVSLEPTGINQFGTLNKKSPNLIVLLTEYSSIYNRLRPIIETILDHGVEDDIAEQLVLKPIHVKMEALSDYVDSLESEVKRVPNEAAVVSSIANKPNIITDQQPVKRSGSFWDNVSMQETQQPLQQQIQQPVYQQQIQQPVYQQQVQQPVYQQPQLVPVQQVQQQTYQRPQQPVYQQQQRAFAPVGQQRNPHQQQSSMFRSPANDDPWASNQQPGRTGW